MTNCRCTIRCPQLPTDAKRIPPDEAKTMSEGAFLQQDAKNERSIKLCLELWEQIKSKLNKPNVSWCEDPITKLSDGCIVLSAEDTMANVEKCINDLGLEITIDRPQIKQRTSPTKMTIGQQNTFDADGKQIFEADGTTPVTEPYEDWTDWKENIDEVLEPLVPGEKKLLKSRAVTNQYKEKMGL